MGTPKGLSLYLGLSVLPPTMWKEGWRVFSKLQSLPVFSSQSPLPAAALGFSPASELIPNISP